MSGGISVPSGQTPRSDGASEPLHVESPKAAYPCCDHCRHLRAIVHRAACRVCARSSPRGLAAIPPAVPH